MNFLRLPDYLLSVLFEDNDIIAVDKPYGINAHTNDSKIEHSEFIQDGLIEIYEKQLGRKLHIIHRLDQTTTGVMIFGKSVEAAKKYAEFFFNREVKKTYWFITKSKSSKQDYLVDQQIIHKGKELDAKTSLSLIKKSKDHELWRANPHTGRNHQIRIHARVVDIPILGDLKYEGAVFQFLCLHNHQIEFPNGIVIISTPPYYFENLDILSDLVLTRALFEYDRRNRLFQLSNKSEQCLRLVHTLNNSREPGFTIDLFGKILVLNWYKEFWGNEELKKFTSFSKIIKKSIIVRLITEKSLLTKKGNEIFISYESVNCKSPEDWIVFENQTQFKISTHLGHSFGLSLDQRLQRNWVENHAKNKTVLNLFSNTGAYSIAAVLGQAVKVTSVEANKNTLNWMKQSLELNKLDPDRCLFLCRDSISYIEQCRNKNIKYDLIICDSPSFMRREKGFFKIELGLEDLIKNCLASLNPKGVVIFATHFDNFYIDEIHKVILKAQKALNILELEINSILPSLDFELADEKANLKSFIIKIG